MAGSLNKVTLIGNVGRDPEIRTTQAGKKIASFSIATSGKWRTREGEQQERTEWHRISVFSEGLVGVIEKYIKRGSKLYIEGQLQTRKWQDQQGNDRYNTDVVLQGFSSQLIMLDGRRDGNFGSSGNYDQGNDRGNNQGNNDYHDNQVQSNQNYVSNDLDDEIPF